MDNDLRGKIMDCQIAIKSARGLFFDANWFYSNYRQSVMKLNYVVELKPYKVPQHMTHLIGLLKESRFNSDSRYVY